MEGFLGIEGVFDGRRYNVSFTYPMIEPTVDSVETWVQQELAALPTHPDFERSLEDLTVADVPARKVLNVMEAPGGPLSHRAYIWRRETKNPALVVIQQEDSMPPDPAHMEQIFDLLLAGIAP